MEDKISYQYSYQDITHALAKLIKGQYANDVFHRVLTDHLTVAIWLKCKRHMLVRTRSVGVWHISAVVLALDPACVCVLRRHKSV